MKITKAAREGNFVLVETILNSWPKPLDIDQQADCWIALMKAVKYSHLDCVKLLIPVVDGCKQDDFILQLASIKKHQEIFDLVYDISKPHNALKNMIEHGFYTEDDMLMLKTRIVLDEKTIIEQDLQQISQQLPDRASKKI